jgi:hypothetical protein
VICPYTLFFRIETINKAYAKYYGKEKGKETGEKEVKSEL